MVKNNCIKYCNLLYIKKNIAKTTVKAKRKKNKEKKIIKPKKKNHFPIQKHSHESDSNKKPPSKVSLRRAIFMHYKTLHVLAHII